MRRVLASLPQLMDERLDRRRVNLPISLLVGYVAHSGGPPPVHPIVVNVVDPDARTASLPPPVSLLGMIPGLYPPDSHIDPTLGRKTGSLSGRIPPISPKDGGTLCAEFSPFLT